MFGDSDWGGSSSDWSSSHHHAGWDHSYHDTSSYNTTSDYGHSHASDYTTHSSHHNHHSHNSHTASAYEVSGAIDSLVGNPGLAAIDYAAAATFRAQAGDAGGASGDLLTADLLAASAGRQQSGSHYSVGGSTFFTATPKILPATRELFDKIFDEAIARLNSDSRYANLSAAVLNMKNQIIECREYVADNTIPLEWWAWHVNTFVTKFMDPATDKEKIIEQFKKNSYSSGQPSPLLTALAAAVVAAAIVTMIVLACGGGLTVMCSAAAIAGTFYGLALFHAQTEQQKINRIPAANDVESEARKCRPGS